MAERVVGAAMLERFGIGAGLTLVQHPVSPFCASISTVLEAAGLPYTTHNVEIWDRRPVIALTDGAYYAIPVLVDARTPRAVVVYEARDDGQDLARYLDAQEQLGLFPAALGGLQEIIVQYIEGQVEDVGFRLNDAYFLPSLPDAVERTMYIRHKERKFGKGCLEQWRRERDGLYARLVDALVPLERMLSHAPYLLGERPSFADYALYGVLRNYTYTAHNHLPPELTQIARWFTALPGVRLR